jgi:hypothetical protein
MKKKNNTLVIVLCIIGGLGLLCCGGIFFAGSKGFQFFSQMNEQYTAVVTSFVNKASAANWDINAVADDVYKGDGNTTRMDSTAMVLTELGKLGTVSKIEGNTTGFNSQTNNGVNTTTFSWSGTVTLTNGTSPLHVDMVKVGEAWQVTDIYLNK